METATLWNAIKERTSFLSEAQAKQIQQHQFIKGHHRNGRVVVKALCCKPEAAGSSQDEVDFLN
jgi:hypothetical protein